MTRPSTTLNKLKGYVSQETVVLRRWEVLHDSLVLSTGLIMWTGHLGFWISLRWPIHVHNIVAVCNFKLHILLPLVSSGYNHNLTRFNVRVEKRTRKTMQVSKNSPTFLCPLSLFSLSENILSSFSLEKNVSFLYFPWSGCLGEPKTALFFTKYIKLWQHSRTRKVIGIRLSRSIVTSYFCFLYLLLVSIETP